MRLINQMCGGLLMLALLTPPAASAAPTIGACSPTKVKYIVSTLVHQTNLPTYGNIPEAALGFVQGGIRASCVIVRFSAEVFAGPSDFLYLRAFLDGTTAALPVEIQFAVADATGPSARSFEFVFPNVPPGNHVVRMQYRSGGGGFVTIWDHTTVLQYQ